MRIGVLGAGPAGLYLSLLMKKADPRHEITVVERNAPDATFGWGVVFSEETLGALRDADHETYLDITESFARWSAIDVHYAGKVVRSGGHVFSGVARKQLLRILQERCRDLGVDMSFHDEVPDLSRFEGFDLVVAADGVNSTVRRIHADWFGPRLDVHRSKYVWFGTDRTFDAFTFIFRATEHGLFQVHAYPFDARTSTFIVECNQATWERAGLERATEEDSIAFCEELFAPELAGHRLMSNRSLWVSFVTVRCESWHHGNVVLLGDAAHTAHFTIGSGTKLAMEDAISLANAFVKHSGPSGLEAALTDYEMERQPVVERFQEAARESSRYFEDVIRYTGFDPLPFAFQLLTRSGRITHLELEKRDPAFVAGVDRWFAERAAPRGAHRAPHGTRVRTHGPLITPPPPLFAPLQLGGATVENRIALRAEPLDPPGGLAAGVASRLLQEVGLVLTPFVAVSPPGRISPATPVAADLPEFVPGVERAPVCVVLGHAGRRGSSRPRSEGLDRPLREGGWEVVSASPVPFTSRSPVPAALRRADMDAVVISFVDAAGAVARSGAGVLLLDFSRGGLVASFLSPLTNRREDGFGGPVEHRLLFPLEVLAAVRDAWEGPLGVRYSATDWAPGGLSRSDSLNVARALAAHADFLDVVAGGTVAEQRPVYGRVFLVPYSDVVRNEAGIPTMTSGNITTADEANTILAAGQADLVVLDPRVYSRPSVRDGLS